MANKIKFTPEQLSELQSFFQNNDFTANITLNRECNLKGEQAEVFVRAKKIFGEYWLGNLRPLGVNREMKNFSKDYPVNLLENTDAEYFSEQISEIYTDPDKLNEYIDRFFEMYGEPVMLGLDCYAKSVGKEAGALTDEEIHTVVEKVAGVIDETLIETVMQGQQVPAIFGVSKKIPQHEDFTERLNQDKINFYNKWTHAKTKLGAPLLFSELSEDEATNIEGAKMFFANNPEEERRYIFLRDEFAKTLNSTDREIYYLLEKGITQKEIAKLLGYKTHSAVSKRMKIMNKDFKKFIGFENRISKNLRRCSTKKGAPPFFMRKKYF